MKSGIKKYRSLLLFLLSLTIPGGLLAQEVTDQDWQTEEDYRAVEEIVLEDILWLENHPLSTNTNNTKEITEYVLNWLAGTPYVEVTYDEIFLNRLTNSKEYYCIEIHV